MVYYRNRLILLGVITAVNLGNGIDVGSKLDFSSSDTSSEGDSVEGKPNGTRHSRLASVRRDSKTVCIGGLCASTVPLTAKQNNVAIVAVLDGFPPSPLPPPCDATEGPCVTPTEPSYNMTDEDIRRQNPVQTVPIYIGTEGGTNGPGFVIPNVPVYKGVAGSDGNPNENTNFVRVGNVNNTNLTRKLIPNYDFRVVPVYKRVKVPPTPRPLCPTTYVYPPRKIYPSPRPNRPGYVRHSNGMHQRYPNPYTAYGLRTRQPIGNREWAPGSKEQWQWIDYQKNQNGQVPTSWQLPWCGASPSKPRPIRPGGVPVVAAPNVDGKLQFPKDDGVTEEKAVVSIAGKLGEFEP